MKILGRPFFGGMEKAFSVNIVMKLPDFSGRRMRYDIFGRKGPTTTNQRRNRKKICRRSGNKAWGAWDILPNELLFSILIKLSIIDFISFSGVCKSWRSACIDFRNYFMEHQKPLLVVRPKFSKKACLLYNMFDAKSYQAMLPDLPCKKLVGLSCGYLITIDKNSGFWLVNLMTKLELRFPVLPEYMGDICYLDICAVLFRSPRLSRTFMVLFSKERNFLLLSESGASSWQKYLLSNTGVGISDVKIFDGKIFVLTSDALLGEFNPMMDPCSKLYNINIPSQIWSNMSMKLVASDNKLYTIIYHCTPKFTVLDRYHSFFEIDHKKMDSAKQILDLGAKSLFLSPFNSAVLDTTGWGGGNCVCVLQSVYLNRCAFFHLNGDPLESFVWGGHSKPYFWYFPSESWDISRVGDEFGT